MDDKCSERRLHVMMAELLAGQRQKLKQDRQIIADFRTNATPTNIVAFNGRAAGRFCSLVGCLTDVVHFIDDHLARYREDLAARKELRELQKEHEELKKGYALAKKINKRQAEELTKLQAVAKSRKSKIERDIMVMRILSDRVDVLKKKDKIRQWKSQTK
jgi:exonuclease VII large subunit